MQLIIGLGNPGKEYENTLHNAGFKAVDKFAAKHGFEWRSARKFKALLAEGLIDSKKVKILKPLTYMNLSGEAVLACISWFDIPIDELIVVYDEADLPIGKIRIRQNGRSAGHRGLQSIIDYLGTDNFPRIRIGIDAPEKKVADLKNFVLTKLSGNIKDLLNSITDEIPEILDFILKSDVESAMNRFNGINLTEKE